MNSSRQFEHHHQRRLLLLLLQGRRRDSNLDSSQLCNAASLASEPAPRKSTLCFVRLAHKEQASDKRVSSAYQLGLGGLAGPFSVPFSYEAR